MKILVLGAGVLGSLYAARLQTAGNDVTILARGERAEQIQQHGIILENDQTGERSITTLRVIETLDPTEPFAFTLVIVRKNQLPSVLPILAASHATPNILFMVNNAAGPQEMIDALGQERILLGFPGAGGERVGNVVRCSLVSSQTQPTTIGELNGEFSARLHRLQLLLREAGFPVTMERNMDAWLKTHVSVVSPIANALYLAGGSNYQLAQTRDGLIQMVRAIKEGQRVLLALNIPTTPFKMRLLAALPEPLLVWGLQKILNTSRAELLMARHANAARDEMQILAKEFQLLACRSGLSTPNIDRLCSYIDPAIPPLPAGSANLPMDWSSVRLALSILCGSLAGLLLLGRLRRR